MTNWNWIPWATKNGAVCDPVRYGQHFQFRGRPNAYSQLFNLLCDKADDFYGGRLPVHVRLILDEFANIGQIPNFDKLIATIRSREISASIILQSQSQLKTIYKDAADTIVGNCDSTLFLGGKEKSTLKEISSCWGKRPLISITSPKTGAARFPTAPVIRN